MNYSQATNSVKVGSTLYLSLGAFITYLVCVLCTYITIINLQLQMALLTKSTASH